MSLEQDPAILDQQIETSAAAGIRGFSLSEVLPEWANKSLATIGVTGAIGGGALALALKFPASSQAQEANPPAETPLEPSTTPEPTTTPEPSATPEYSVPDPYYDTAADDQKYYDKYVKQCARQAKYSLREVSSRLIRGHKILRVKTGVQVFDDCDEDFNGKSQGNPSFGGAGKSSDVGDFEYYTWAVRRAQNGHWRRDSKKIHLSEDRVSSREYIDKKVELRRHRPGTNVRGVVQAKWIPHSDTDGEPGSYKLHSGTLRIPRTRHHK